MYTGPGIMVDSGPYTGLASEEGKERLADWLEERGLGSRSILNNPDLRPQSETTTKFADVKGVDEAKVGGWVSPGAAGAGAC